MFRVCKRKIALCLTLLLIVSCVTPAVNAAGGVEWAGTYSSPDNNTVTAYPLPTDASVEQVWAAKVGNSPIVIVDGYIYTCHSAQGGGGKGTLYKLDKNSGEIVKTAETGLVHELQYSHITYGGNLFYISVPSAIAAYDPVNLTQKWIYTRNTAKTSDFASVQYVNGCVVSNGIVLDAITGELKKDLYDFGTGYHWANGAEVNGTYYVAAGSFLRAFDTTTWVQTSLCNTGVDGGSGAGVMHYNGRLYWADQLKGKFYSVALNEDGMLDRASFKTVDTNGVNTYTTPVAYGRRIYLAGNTTTLSNNAGTASVLAFNAQTLDLERTVDLPAGVEGNKIQSTPILHPVTNGGAEVASIEAYGIAGISNTNTTTAYIYVQDYHTPGKVYMIIDDGSQTTGDPIALITPGADLVNFAYEQLACDADGAIYCTNNSGYLMKWQSIRAGKPAITKNLSTEEISYAVGVTADQLEIQASVDDNGTLRYQWYKRTGIDGKFEAISGATESVYTPSTTEIGTIFYKCTVTNVRGTDANSTDSKIAMITVAGIKRGDVNGDDKIDQNDVMVLIRYLAEYEEHIVESAADNNQDGKIDLLDLIRLRRHLAWGFSI